VNKELCGSLEDGGMLLKQGHVVLHVVGFTRNVGFCIFILNFASKY